MKDLKIDKRYAVQKPEWSSFPVWLDSEQLAVVKKIAEENGVTVEEACHALVCEALGFDGDVD